MITLWWAGEHGFRDRFSLHTAKVSPPRWNPTLKALYITTLIKGIALLLK